MSISRQNLSIVIVTLKSEKVVHNCIKSINQDIPVIVVENSNNHKFKEEIELKYKNLKCILSGSNLGMGAGNNIGIKEAKTDYVLILNPDVILEDNSLDELILTSNKIPDFAILSPKEKNIINYGMFNKKILLEQNSKDEPFKVDFVDGFAMLINKKKFQDNIFFDEKFFMFLENDDLCKRAIDNGDSIYVIPKAKIKHLTQKAVDEKFSYEVELSRNWHWIWSKFYFHKKHYGFFSALKEGGIKFILSSIKYLFYFLTNNKKKYIYFNRVSGFFSALIGKSSSYRPNLED